MTFNSSIRAACNRARLAIPFIVLVLLIAFCVAACMSDRDEKRDGPGDDDNDDDDDDFDDPIPPVGGDPLSWSDPVQIGPLEGRTPSLQIDDPDTMHVAYFVPDPEKQAEGYLYFQPITIGDLEAGEAVEVAADAHRALWEYDGQHIDMAAVRSLHIVHMISEDNGAGWTQGDRIANSDSGGCPDKPPIAFATDPEDRIAMAFGFEHHSALFGCVCYVHLTTLQDGEWAESVQAGNGIPNGVFFLDDSRIVIAADFAVYISSDGGKTFQEVADGDYTRNQVRGADSAVMQDGSIWLASDYSWGNKYYASICASDAQVQNWTSPYWVLAEHEYPIFDPRIAVDGDNVIVVWLEARTGEVRGSYYLMQAFSRISRDGGKTFSEELRIGPDEPEMTIEALELSARYGHAAVFFKAGGGETYGEGGLFVSTAEY